MFDQLNKKENKQTERGVNYTLIRPSPVLMANKSNKGLKEVKISLTFEDPIMWTTLPHLQLS